VSRVLVSSPGAIRPERRRSRFLVSGAGGFLGRHLCEDPMGMGTDGTVAPIRNGRLERMSRARALNTPRLPRRQLERSEFGE
jgi:hypothetical protein